MGKSHAAGMFTGNSGDSLLCAGEVPVVVDVTRREDMCAMLKSSTYSGTLKLSACRDENATVSCVVGSADCSSVGEISVPVLDVGTLSALDFG